MLYDVFISHSREDKGKVSALCSALEARQIRCWIAPRDIPQGAEWGAAIHDAISQSRMMVLVLSSKASQSEYVKLEAQGALDRRIPVIPLRIEEIKPAGTLGFLVSSRQWIDAFTPPFEKHLESIGLRIQNLLNGDRTSAAAAKPKVRPVPMQVHSLEEARELSWGEGVLLITFYAEPGLGEGNIIKRLKQEVFPQIRPSLEARGMSICFARARGALLLHTSIGKQLKKLGVDALGSFLFIEGQLVSYSPTSATASGNELAGSARHALALGGRAIP